MKSMCWHRGHLPKTEKLEVQRPSNASKPGLLCSTPAFSCFEASEPTKALKKPYRIVRRMKQLEAKPIS